MDNLKEQARQIDTPLKPEIAPIELNLSNLGIRDLPLAPARTQMRAEQNAFNRSPVIQREFDDWDPNLDAGVLTGQNQYYNRAENQTNWDRTVQGLKKIGLEVSLGTLEAAALIGDLQMHYKAIAGQERDFSNRLSTLIGDYKEEMMDKHTAVYRKQEDEGFSPGSWSFWMDNADSIATTLTLMIPSMGVVKGLSATAKLSKASKFFRMGNKTRKVVKSVSGSRGLAVAEKLTGEAGKQLAKGVTGAVVSRLGENAMEASETVKELTAELKELQAQGVINKQTGEVFTDDDIRELAGQAGVSTWRQNSWMILQDFYQYRNMFKGIDFARRAAKETGKKAMFKKFMGKAAEFVVGDMAGEGFEEGFQETVSMEAQYKARLKAGVTPETHFLDRMSELIVSDEFKTSVLLGAFGGGLFGGGAHINSAVIQRMQKKDRMRTQDVYNTYYESVFGSSESFSQAEDRSIITSAIQKAELGKIDDILADLATMKNEDPEALRADGVDPDVYFAKLEESERLVAKVEKTYNDVHNDGKIPNQLKNAAVFNRMNMELVESYENTNNKKRNELHEADKQLHAERELFTAEKMVELKRLEHSGNTQKAKDKVKEILEISEVYKSEDDIYEALSTSNDLGFAEVKAQDEMNKKIRDHIRKFEEKLKTPEGQEDLIKDATKRAEEKAAEDAKAAEEAAAQAQAESEAEAAGEQVPDSEEAGDVSSGTLDLSKVNAEQKKYHEERNKVAEEKGRFRSKTPDGKTVFNTHGKGHQRTWVKGERVKDAKGNTWEVENPVYGGSDLYLGRVGYTDKKGEINRGLASEIVKKYGELSHETEKSFKPGEWTVNDLQYENKKKIAAEKKKEQDIAESAYQDVLAGVIKTSGSEFTNFSPGVDENGRTKKTGKGYTIFEFDGDPNASDASWFPIDYKAAAMPMERTVNEDGEGVPIEQKARLVLEVAEKGSKRKDAIRVEQTIDGKPVTVAMIMPKGMDQQFRNLLKYLPTVGGSAEVTVIGKTVTIEGNLGTIPNSKTSLSSLRGSEFLPNGKVYLGSRKNTVKEGKEIMFYPEDGSEPISFALSDKQIDIGVYSGHTYMLLLTPDGFPIPIQLNEATLSEIQVDDAQGNKVDLATKIMDDLEVAADQIQDDFNSFIAQEIEEGSSIIDAFEKAQVEFGFKDVDKSASLPVVQSTLNRIIDPYVRRVRQAPEEYTDSRGKSKIRYKTTKNFFRVRFEVIQGEGAIDNKVEIRIGDAEASGENTWKAKDAESREEAIEKLGKRFFVMSADQIASPEGGSYVKEAVENDWVTTDIYSERPWVNPRLKLQLNAEGKKALKKDIKAVRKKSPKAGKSKSQNDVSIEDEIIAVRKERTTTARLEAPKITDFMDNLRNRKPYTVAEYIADHLEGMVTEAEFLEIIKEYDLVYANSEGGGRSKKNNAIKDAATFVLDNATPEQLGVDTKIPETKPVEGTVSDKAKAKRDRNESGERDLGNLREVIDAKVGTETTETDTTEKYKINPDRRNILVKKNAKGRSIPLNKSDISVIESKIESLGNDPTKVSEVMDFIKKKGFLPNVSSNIEAFTDFIRERLSGETTLKVGENALKHVPETKSEVKDKADSSREVSGFKSEFTSEAKVTPDKKKPEPKKNPSKVKPAAKGGLGVVSGLKPKRVRRSVTNKANTSELTNNEKATKSKEDLVSLSEAKDATNQVGDIKESLSEEASNKLDDLTSKGEARINCQK